ncbi:MAG: hypothetical protein ONB12_08355 [candidate division KSB1 bacterium]|nr:hypothetical protein [candidate division KSB1 bacterium]
MIKAYIIIAILGTLWGIAEVQLGTLLHAVDLPFAGLLMMSLGIVFQTVARLTTAMRGSALLMGAVAVFLKLLLIGGIAASVAVAIMIESLIIEALYWQPLPSQKRIAVAAGAGVTYTLFHPFLSMPLFMGLTPLDAYRRILQAGKMLFGIKTQDGFILIFVMLTFYFFVGFITGFLTYGFVDRLRQRGLLPLPVQKV